MRIFSYFNLTLLFLIGIIGASFFLISSKRNAYAVDASTDVEEISLPKNPFLQKDEAYKGWESGSLSLQWVAPKLTIPDLSSEICYFGKNHRPDVAEGKSRFYISLKKNTPLKAVLTGDKVYLKYAAGAFSFSGHQTPLWLEMDPMSDENGQTESLNVRVFLKDEENNIITAPTKAHFFTLAAEEKKGALSNWEIGGYRADASLLLRQGARLAGTDVFLDMHGGEEFKETKSRERLDFISSEENYFCFVKEGDFLIWKENRWARATDEDATENSPLIVVRKVDDKAITLELWDIDGKHKIPLSLLRAKNYDPPFDLTQEFKVIGAKTWVECIVECHEKRLLLKEGDWVVLTQDGWRKISSEEEVDDYVNQKLQGPLFVLDKINKKNGQTVLAGHFFNALRTSVANVELASCETILKGITTE